MLQTVFLTVLNMSITASTTILIVLLARLLLKGTPKIFSYALWAVVLFRLLCPVSLTAGFSLFNIGEAPAGGDGTFRRMEYVSLQREDPPRLPLSEPADDVGPAASQPTQVQSSAEEAVSPLAIASGVWLLGVAAMLLFNAVQLGKLRRQLICSAPLRGNVYLADHIPTPFVIGLVHPRIYLPSTLTEAEQAYIVPHEEHHIRRGDPITKLLAFGALCLHWFNPLVWLAFVLASRDMEMSCDEAVIRRVGREIRAEYSLSLLRFSAGKKLFIGTPLAFGEGNTKERIENVMRYRKPKGVAVVLALVLCLVLAACLSSNPKADEGEDEGQSDVDSGAVDDLHSEVSALEQAVEFTGLVAGVDREENGLYVKTAERYGFSQADAVMVYLPTDVDVSQWTEGDWVKIAYIGAPEVVEPNDENKYEENTAIFSAEQVAALRDYLTWGEDSTGTISETVGFGEYSARIIVQFTYDVYEVDGADYKIRDIVSARAENLSGWLSVKSDVEIDTQGIIYAKDRQQAIIPFTYFASIGEGLAEYTGVVSIDLSAFAPMFG